MFLGTPLEEPFRVIVWVVIGLPIAGLILWLGLTFLAITLTATALMWGVVLAMAGYLLGIPWSIWLRVTRGRWPSAD